MTGQHGNSERPQPRLENNARKSQEVREQKPPKKEETATFLPQPRLFRRLTLWGHGPCCSVDSPLVLRFSLATCHQALAVGGRARLSPFLSQPTLVHCQSIADKGIPPAGMLLGWHIPPRPRPLFPRSDAFAILGRLTHHPISIFLSTDCLETACQRSFHQLLAPIFAPECTAIRGASLLLLDHMSAALVLDVDCHSHKTFASSWSIPPL
jgi:hypothetical protein